MPKYVPTQQEIDEATKYYSSVATYLEGGGGAKAYLLEQKGWEEWLMTLFPFWFSESFSKEHRQYWELRWNTLQKIKAGEHVDDKDKVVLLLIARGLGKSAAVEAARVMRGAILGKGYSLMISETEDQAQEHLGNVRILIDSPDSKLLEYYPQMAIAENSDVTKGMPTADRKELFICKNGWICRAKGLTAKMRGIRIGNERPTEIAMDDIDDVNDSLAVSLSKERQITASILPVQARKDVIVDFGQNLILEHGFANRVFTGKSDALSERTVIGVTNAFDPLHIESKIDALGQLRHYIADTSVPTWEGLDIKRAQKFLNDSGLQTFLAEYQNEFDQYKSGKVISNYDEERQIITWSEFEKVFGQRRIPKHWRTMVGLDIGYTEGLYPHYSAWSFIATAAMNSAVPRAVFLYRSRSFKGTSIDDQAKQIKSELYPEEMEMMQQWLMSHEKTGEMLTLQQKYNLPMGKVRQYKKEDGVAQWKHMSVPDKTKPHPFKPDTLNADGTYYLGRPSLFYIVDDDQEKRPIDDKGLRLFREQVSGWEYVPVKITDTGMTEQKPSKINDDVCFVAGTRITTSRGDVNIEDVQVGDYVYTRTGCEKVVNAACTQEGAEIWEAVWNDGTTLRGTANHPIITTDGIVPLRWLASSDKLLWWKENPNALILTESHIIDTPILNAGHIETTFRHIKVLGDKVFHLCTSLFGKTIIKEKSLTGIISIIETAIRSIMLSKIWNYFPQRNIEYITAASQYLKKDGRCCWNIWRERERKRLSGIKVSRDESGTALCRVKVGPSANLWLNSAKIAWRNMRVWSGQIGQNFVPLFVGTNLAFAGNNPDVLCNANIATNSYSLLKWNAFFATSDVPKRLRCKIKQWKKNVLSVTSYLSHNDGQRFVAPSLVSVNFVTHANVYNLTVENTPEYYANGVLVHNCDSFRYVLNRWAATATELTPHEELELAMPEAYRMENMLKVAPHGRLTDAQQFSRSLVEGEVREKLNMPYEDEWLQQKADVESWEIDGW